MASVIEDFGGQIHPHTFTGSIGGKTVFMTHIPSGIEEIAASGKYDLVIYGHTHERDVRKIGDCLLINPGETTDWITGKSGIVILDLDKMEPGRVMRLST